MYKYQIWEMIQLCLKEHFAEKLFFEYQKLIYQHMCRNFSTIDPYVLYV